MNSSIVARESSEEKFATPLFNIRIDAGFQVPNKNVGKFVAGHQYHGVHGDAVQFTRVGKTSETGPWGHPPHFAGPVFWASQGNITWARKKNVKRFVMKKQSFLSVGRGGALDHTFETNAFQGVPMTY